MKQTKSGKELLELSNSLVFKIWDIQEKLNEIHKTRELNFVEKELYKISEICYDLITRSEILQVKEHQKFLNKFADKVILQIREKLE